MTVSIRVSENRFQSARTITLPDEYKGLVPDRFPSFNGGPGKYLVGRHTMWNGPTIKGFPSCCGARILAEFPFEYQSAHQDSRWCAAALKAWWRVEVREYDDTGDDDIVNPDGTQRIFIILTENQRSLFGETLKELGFKPSGRKWANCNSENTLTCFTLNIFADTFI